VGIGCTGGRHRSVMIANEVTKRLRRAGYDAHAVHRDMRKSSMEKTSRPGRSPVSKK